VATQRTGGRAADEGALLTLSGISKSFGPVQALRQVDLEVRGGELLGLVGHNGAGKSTLMNILIGVTSPDRGEIILESQAMDQRYGPAMAHRLGIRCVFQELSLCPNLSAVENALIVHPTLEGTGWKRRAKSLILTQLHDMFPSHGIDVETPVGNLPIGQRQMVEIARAFTESNNLAKLVILDEPTSSLDSSAAQQLLRFLRRTVIDGKACILITHKLTEVLNFAQRVVVMKDAGVVADVSGSGLSRERLFTLMGSVERATLPAQVSSFAGMRRVDVAGEAGRPSELRIEAGETVGLAGLAGHGQKEVLHRIYAASRSGRDKGCRVTGSAAYVSGDRQREGIFPLWSIASNITIASVRSLSRGSFINPAKEQRLAEAWRKKINIRSKSVLQSILSLSGGNRQKALVARAFATDAEIILFDDPTRGVDFDTKRELYSQIDSAARSGRCFVWYTTETDELFLCDRIYVFHEGKVVDSLVRSELSEERLLQASFHEAQG
jgi:ribose transport system ATP-binding protein